MVSRSHVAADFVQKGTEFLKVELQTGRTFADMAMGEEPGSAERAKAQRNARKAYDTVIRLRGRLENIEKIAERQIDEQLGQLRSALQRLGEKFA